MQCPERGAPDSNAAPCYRYLLEHNLEVNPLLSRYKTAVEITAGGHGVPIVNSSVVDDILAASRARGPTMPDGHTRPDRPPRSEPSGEESDAAEDERDEVRSGTFCRHFVNRFYSRFMLTCRTRPMRMATSPAPAPAAPARMPPCLQSLDVCWRYVQVLPATMPCPSHFISYAALVRSQAHHKPAYLLACTSTACPGGTWPVLTATMPLPSDTIIYAGLL